ncbi:hypothetical protein R1sor_020412 [Riccia sorocarpa]|uniref:Plant heme peroxidase family profile domain-containing protein n=1 Tax=Riccia sorocarpa TaxID=122646 RepID=A0ABD3IF83_9MARC
MRIAHSLPDLYSDTRLDRGLCYRVNFHRNKTSAGVKYNVTGKTSLYEDSADEGVREIRQRLLQEPAGRKGIFITDATLIRDSLGKKIVTDFAKAKSTFFEEFAAGMVKMGILGVLTGSQGEIRKKCQFVN